MSKEKFEVEIREGYPEDEKSLLMGTAMYDNDAIEELNVRIPLKMLNRHGLIAGATGTGKTKSLQGMAEGMSRAGIPVLLMDIKGDLSGLGAEGSNNEVIEYRQKMIGEEYLPEAFPLEFLSLSDEPGLQLRATVTEFGPILLSKILNLNSTQSGLLSAIFKCADDNGWLLLDLDDLKTTISYASGEGKELFEKSYGKMSTVSAGTILRKVIELETQNADQFFGEPSFDVYDLMRHDEKNRGIISVLRVTDMQDRPKLFSTFMLQLLAELYATLPEEGDLDKPKLVLFIDEAHLLFKEASDVLLDQIETVIKLIRSKGVGIYFCTQNPTDVPDAVLGQLGLKVQHALRAFTAKDRKNIKKAAENYPDTEYYQTDELITEMGIGVAMVTALSKKGIPTPLVEVLMRPPSSRMDVLDTDEIKRIIAQSDIYEKYDQTQNKESAYEVLTKKVEDYAQEKAEEKKAKKTTKSSHKKEDKSLFEEVLENPVTKSVMRNTAKTIVRSLLGSIGLSTRRRR